MEDSEYALLDRLEAEMWWYRGLHRQLTAAINDALQQGPAGPILDAGCGTGGSLSVLRCEPQRHRLFGLEINPAAAIRAANKSGVPIVAGSVNLMPFAASAFSVVLSADVICHARVDPAAALAEAARVTMPGGHVVLNLPAYEWLKSAHDARVHNARRFTAAGVRRLMRAAGLEVVRTTYWNSFLLPLMIARRFLVRGDAGKSDVMEYPAPLNALFGAILSFERFLIALGLRLPTGGSLLVVARKNV